MLRKVLPWERLFLDDGARARQRLRWAVGIRLALEGSGRLGWSCGGCFWGSRWGSLCFSQALFFMPAEDILQAVPNGSLFHGWGFLGRAGGRFGSGDETLDGRLGGRKSLPGSRRYRRGGSRGGTGSLSGRLGCGANWLLSDRWGGGGRGQSGGCAAGRLFWHGEGDFGCGDE